MSWYIMIYGHKYGIPKPTPLVLNNGIKGPFPKIKRYTECNPAALDHRATQNPQKLAIILKPNWSNLKSHTSEVL